MVLENLVDHPEGEDKNPADRLSAEQLEVETFDGKLFVEWDPEAAVTPLAQLPFFIQFLKLGGRFEPWVADCPLRYASPNAPKKVDVLGSLFLSVLSGHTRYAHMAALLGDGVNSKLLGMNKVVSDDSARRALQKIPEKAGIHWLQTHLQRSYEPLLHAPWILDCDVTVKPLYGHQEGAVIGYNPHKPGRPCHTYHTYMMANLRLVLEVEVQAGNQSHSSYSAPGLLGLLDRLPRDGWPAFVRGDCDWGSGPIMDALDDKDMDYLFKLRKSKNVQRLIYKHHGSGDWQSAGAGFEAKADEITLQGWGQARRALIVRRRIKSDTTLLLESEATKQLALIDGPEDIKVYEYSVLVTSLTDEVITVVQHYRDRADCENVFDEIKNQWGWGGFTTQKQKPCEFMARIIALIYNWWSLYVRMVNLDAEGHQEAITSKPLLLTGVGRLTTSGRQRIMTITSHHGKSERIRELFQQLSQFFYELKANAPQLTSGERWQRILAKAVERIVPLDVTGPPGLPPPVVS